MATEESAGQTENKHQQRNRVSTRAMLEAAAELIAEGGLGAVTLVAVGERAGFSRGLVSARFGSKAGMITALVDLISGRWRVQTVNPAQRGATGLDAMCTFVDALWKQAERDDTHLRVLYTLMFEAVGPAQGVRDEIVALQREQISQFTDHFRRGIADGSIDGSIEPTSQAMLLAAELRGVAYLWMIDPASTDAVAGFRLVRETLVERVAAS